MMTAVFIIIVLALLFLGAAYWIVSSQNKKRTESLRGQFGTEYDRAVADTGDRRDAEAMLEERRKRVERLELHPLSEVQRQEYAQRWRDIQARFVDDPAGAVSAADGLVNATMTARGYPMGEFDQRSADISVDHPQVVANYRAAHKVSLSADAGEASTEDLRQAMVHYRALFEDLLTPEPAVARR